MAHWVAIQPPIELPPRWGRRTPTAWAKARSHATCSATVYVAPSGFEDSPNPARSGASTR
jgi:hypothetical protein